MPRVFEVYWKGACSVAREVLGDYLAAVGAQVRWRRARKPLLRELSDHIADQAADYRAQGLEGEAALTRAVDEMGDPEEVGRALDRLHRPQNRWGIALAALLLAIAGVFFQFMAYETTGPGMIELYPRQFLWVPISFALLCAVWFSDCTLLLRRWWAVGLTAAATLWAIHGTNGTHRPTALYVSLLLPVLYAALLCRLRGRGSFTVLLCALAAWVLPLPALLVPSSSAYLLSGGTMLLTLSAAAGLGWFSGRRRNHLLLSWAPALFCLGVLLSQSRLFLKRMAAFLHPELDLNGGGYFYFHLRHGLDAIFFDNVLNSTDLMLAFLAWRAGRWVFPLAAALLVLAALLLLRRVGRLHSRSGKLLALSALLPLLLQGGLYLLFDMGYSPLAPLSLPFLSHGIGYLLVDSLLAGILLSVFRMDALLRDKMAGTTFHPLPDQLVLPLGKGKLLIQYHKTP